MLLTVKGKQLTTFDYPRWNLTLGLLGDFGIYNLQKGKVWWFEKGKDIEKRDSVKKD